MGSVRFLQRRQDQVQVRRALATVLPTARCDLHRAMLCGAKTCSGGLRKVKSRTPSREASGLKVRDQARVFRPCGAACCGCPYARHCELDEHVPVALRQGWRLLALF